VWHAEQDKQIRRSKVMGLWWYEVMEPVRPAEPAAPVVAPPAGTSLEQPIAPNVPIPRDMEYVPRPGSGVEKAAAYLREHGETMLDVLAEGIGIANTSVTACLASAVAHGYIRREKRKGRIWMWLDGSRPERTADPVELACSTTAAAEQLEQASLDTQEREAQDRMLAPSPPLQLPRELMPPPAPRTPSELEKRLRHTIQELESALAARDERIAALLEQSAPAEQPADLRVTLSVSGTAHQAERISAFVRSMTEVRG
jgi:hypothetical protein